MELYAKNRVDSSGINSVSVKKSLREKDDSSDRDSNYYSQNSSQKIDYLLVKNRNNRQKTTLINKELSLVDAICAPPKIASSEENLL